MPGIGANELAILLLIVLLLFGAKRLPELARSLGQSARELRRASAEADDDTAPAKPAERDLTS